MKKIIEIKKCLTCMVDIEVTSKHPNKKYCSIKCSKIGSNNPNWVGENVSYNALHTWINTHLEKPDKCQNCHKDKKLDAANISGEYKRDFSDWEWLCRSCHMQKDNRINNLFRHKKTLFSKKCIFCLNLFEPQNSTSKFCSRLCYFNQVRKIGKSQYNKK